MQKEIVKILTIDGGGIRGLIPSIILKELESKLQKLGNDKKFYEIFDLIAGTSTGGIIALGLSVPPNGLKTEEIINFYETDGKKIFPNDIFSKLKNDIRQLTDEKYEKKPLEKILKNIFNEYTLQDSLTNLLIPAYDTENRNTIFFKKRARKKWQKKDLNFYMKDVARATSAAPTFFEASKITSVNKEKKICCIDGGVFCNNPAMAGYIEALKIFPNAKEYVIVSLGTGQDRKKYDYNEIKDWGIIDWVNPIKGTPILSILTGGESASVNHQMKNIPNVNFFRYDDKNLLKECEAIDDSSNENRERLKKIAFNIIKENEESLDEICKILLGKEF
ncbi:CBASS cGAMP-activated phospholipase [Haliovirga abyssi]|uniref:Patatin n=1 Tax=Haliovirga abyssi TaxID=2996794 RepID=A0AAU9DRI9_9FUSO|nr:CBASS cGAMP-activated phospholipase [Haliovirga abyssi]BDU49554.1 patatin [Haliovirga abyssi]